MNKPKDWMSIIELQKYVNLVGRHWSRTYIQVLVKDKKLPSFKISAARVFIKKDVDKYLETIKKKPQPKKTLDRK